MNTLFLIAVMTGPPFPTPTRIAWIVVEPAQAESQAVESEWRREGWPLESLRWECEDYFIFRFTTTSRTVGISQVPCLVLGGRQYPIRASYSGQAIGEIKRLVRQHVHDDGGIDDVDALQIQVFEAQGRWPR